MTAIAVLLLLVVAGLFYAGYVGLRDGANPQVASGVLLLLLATLALGLLIVVALLQVL